MIRYTCQREEFLVALDRAQMFAVFFVKKKGVVFVCFVFLFVPDHPRYTALVHT